MNFLSAPTPYYQDEHVTLYHGDCRTVLASLPEQSINCCVTSPPYWGLRDYRTATWDGGDAGCSHRRPATGGNPQQGPNKGNNNEAMPERGVCSMCGARRIDAQLGLEPTPDAYVAKMVEVFREVRRVLRDDGTLWLNLGDSYAGSGKGQMGDGSASDRRGAKQSTSIGTLSGGLPTNFSNLKPKDLVGIPWRVAFALQADGWYLRSDIIWHKPNPMPESVKDRCTKAHEYIFLLTKNKKYYYDNEAIKEPAKCAGYSASRRDRGSRLDSRRGTECNSMSGKTGTHRNKRSVWTITPKPFRGAHFAVFPPDLIEPCILAGCPDGGIVLDPFGGSGTTAEVSKERGRKCVSIELNSDYLLLQTKRLAQAEGS